MSPPVLSPDQSAVLRDRLLVEIADLPSEDSATNWAQRALAAKNQLTAADARLLEVAFELRLSALLPSESSEPSIGSRLSVFTFVSRRGDNRQGRWFG